MSADQALLEIEKALLGSGLNAALRVLNDRVPHRFTAVYKAEGDAMRNVAIVDKAGEVVPADFLSVPMQDSFCQYVLQDGDFVTGNSALESRLDGHVYKGVLNSYVGLTIITAQGDHFGTLCHFDFLPQQLAEGEYEFLGKAVRLLPPYVIS